MRAFSAVPAVLVALTLGACGSLDLLGGSSRATGACAAAAPDPALNTPIDRYAMDQWLLDSAVRGEVNRQRCKRGLTPLAEDPALARAASLHSGDMVVHKFFDHNSPVAGRTTPTDRLNLTGASYSRLAENIASLSVYDFDDRHFVIRDAANCDFAFSRGGPAILPRTYAGAAEALVESWMDSPGHRKNILNPDMTRVGTGAAVKPEPQICGELVVVQNFAG